MNGKKFKDGIQLLSNPVDAWGACPVCKETRKLRFLLYSPSDFEATYIQICGKCVEDITDELVVKLKENTKKSPPARIYQIGHRIEQNSHERRWRIVDGKIEYECYCGMKFSTITDFYNHKQKCQIYKEKVPEREMSKIYTTSVEYDRDDF